MTGWENINTLNGYTRLKVFTDLTDIKSKNGQEKTVSITLNQLITLDVQIFVTEHDRHNNRHNRTSIQVLVKND